MTWANLRLIKKIRINLILIFRLLVKVTGKSNANDVFLSYSKIDRAFNLALTL